VLFDPGMQALASSFRRVFVRVALVGAVLAATAACGPTASGTVIDGFAIGAQSECSERNEYEAAECRTYIPLATAALDRRDPGHAPIISVTLHEQLYLGEDGVPRLAVCSGGCMDVAVFRLLDGSVRAIAVGTPGVSTEAMTVDYGSIDPPPTR
jgi:hypothetical protein